MHLPHTTGKLSARSIEGQSGIYRVFTKERKIITIKEPHHRETSEPNTPGIVVPVDTEEDDDEEDKPRSEGGPDLQEPEARTTRSSRNHQDRDADPPERGGHLKDSVTACARATQNPGFWLR